MKKNSCLLKHNDELSNNLLRLFSFFDLFDYPLSFCEIKKYLSDVEKNENLSLVNSLENLIENNTICLEKGFYFLKNRDSVVHIRRQRHNYYLRKLNKAKFFAKIFSFLPFIKMIALVNTIGSFNLKDGGDIDFFIITKKNRIWISRLYCTGIAKMLHSRPNKKTKKDKICLSFYLAENNLNLSKLKLSEGDPYFDIWEKDMNVIYDRDNYFEKFKLANSKESNDDILNKRNNILDKIELLCKKIQLNIMPDILKKESVKKQGVVIDNDIIKLYLVDKRSIIKEKYEEKFRSYLEKNN